MQTMDEMVLQLELAHFLDGFWATGIWVLGTEVRGMLSTSDE